MPKDISLPYVPEGDSSYETGDSRRDFARKKFIVMFQTPVKPKDSKDLVPE